MPLEDLLAANTAALKEMTAALVENTRITAPIAGAVAEKRAAGGAPPADPPATGRGRGGRRAAAAAQGGFLPPDPKDMTIDNFQNYALSWLAAGDASDAAAPERLKRKEFLLDLSEHLEIERIGACEPEDRPIIVDIMKKWVVDPKVDYKAMLPMESKQPERGVV